MRAYQSVEGWGLHFLASMDPLFTRDGAELASRLPSAAAADLLEWESGSTPQRILEKLVNAEQPVDRFIRAVPSVPPNADNRPINEYFFLRDRGLLWGDRPL